MEVRQAGDSATGNEIHGLHFPELVCTQVLRFLPKGWQPQPQLSWGLWRTQLLSSREPVSNGRRGWQEIRLSLVLGGCWVQLGTWSSFLQLLGTGSQGMLACVSLAFLGPTLLTLKSMGPSIPPLWPHRWYILSH